MNAINIKGYFYNLVTDKDKGAASALIKWLLFLLSLIYGFIICVLIFIRSLNRYRANCTVISVGNITLGGTGKTPLVEYLAKYLKAQGHKVAILSRGYKRQSTRIQEHKSTRAQEHKNIRAQEHKNIRAQEHKNIRAQEHKGTSYEVMGDEPYMLQENLKDVPVVVNADRKQGISIAINDYGADTVVMDDGFQQWGIKKDLDIVTIDAVNPFGNRHILPRGILRQPLSALKNADIFIITKTDMSPKISDIRNILGEVNPSAIIIESVHKPVGFYPLGNKQDLSGVDSFKGKTAILASGIANPDAFKDMIINLGVKIIASFDFPDHYSYSPNDWDNITRLAKEKNAEAIIITEKDAVRLSRLPAADHQIPIFVLRIEISITKNEERLHNRLRQLYPA